MIVMGLMNDWVLRNLLCSSFAAEARQRGLQLHGMVYPQTYRAYRDLLESELGMRSEPQPLTDSRDFDSPHLDRLAFRSALYRSGRVNCRTYRTYRRRRWVEQGGRPVERIKLEASFLAGRIGGKLGWHFGKSKEYLRELGQTSYVRNECIPHLEQIKTQLLVSTSPETFYDLPWMLAAEQLGIRRAIWIRSWDNITSKIGILPDADVFLVWSQLMADDLKRYYPEYADREIIIVGAPQFDRQLKASDVIPRKEFCTQMRLDPDRPIVLHSTGGPHICPREHLIIQEVQEALQSFNGAQKPQLLVRLHPYFWNTDISVYENVHGATIWPRREDVLKMVAGTSTGLFDDYQIMISSFYHQAVNVNVASTVTLDSAIFNRPVINIAFDGPQKLPKPLRLRGLYWGCEHYIPVIKSGAVDLVWNRQELTVALRNALEDPGRRSKYRQRVVETVCGPLDGYAGRRLAEAFAQITDTGAAKRTANDASKALVAAL